jgi:hypothetical protein
MSDAVDCSNLTRKQLYTQVWSTPIRKLALKYGLSDVGLAKLCKRHDIPRPERGYWAKLQFGKAPPKTRLPRPDEEPPGEPSGGTLHFDPGQIRGLFVSLI